MTDREWAARIVALAFVTLALCFAGSVWLQGGLVMDARCLARLRVLLGAYSTTRGPWHAGRTVGRTLYCGDGPDDLIGVMDTRNLAELVVLLHEYAREQLLGEGNGGAEPVSTHAGLVPVHDDSAHDDATDRD